MIVLDNGFLSDWLLQIYSPSLVLPSHSDIVFHRAEILILIEFSLSVIPFVDCAFGVIYKGTTIPKVISVFSFVSFQEFHNFAFHIYVYDSFWVNFVKSKHVSRGLFIYFFHVNVLLFQYNLLKRLPLLHFLVFAILSKVPWQYLWRPISGLSIFSHWSVYQLFCQHYTVMITVGSSKC